MAAKRFRCDVCTQYIISLHSCDLSQLTRKQCIFWGIEERILQASYLRGMRKFRRTLLYSMMYWRSTNLHVFCYLGRVRLSYFVTVQQLHNSDTERAYCSSRCSSSGC
ncbi:hypothetical protein BS78_05G176300 [Paspalum vaginatum]|nr:hypothetical protein BS78_05G176300 [Paspalum vaginatum]